MNIAFGITEEDVENVLSQQVARIRRADGESLEDLSWRLFPRLDRALIERCALAHHSEMSGQTESAYEEIDRQLTAMGALHPKEGV